MVGGWAGLDLTIGYEEDMGEGRHPMVGDLPCHIEAEEVGDT